MAYLDKDPTDPRMPRLDRDWLASREKDELIDIILEMKATMPRQTSKLDTGPTIQALENVFNRRKGTAPITEYKTVPGNAENWRGRLVSTPWRVRLSSADPGHMPLYLELRGDVFVGRSGTGMAPDIDLTDFSGERLGVSRQHALIRPTESDILLVDLGSTNGTAVNGRKLSSGGVHKLADGDTISFGLLHFELRIMGRPWSVVAKALAAKASVEQEEKVKKEQKVEKDE